MLKQTNQKQTRYVATAGVGTYRPDTKSRSHSGTNVYKHDDPGGRNPLRGHAKVSASIPPIMH